ncbi:Pentatricopeptide repeat-containing protein, chloroplastic [Vitis vinifera]|uniref:Pentatricopeptide repeat-containing protein, chloroplastic n=1 Tax=Vitis vinifera TaxID=29760 RepID=A0A438GQQ4_VITVI|nr:Pentatricopeptide repeat-containing protein, chloroplastic [Vitis vinifera]
MNTQTFYFLLQKCGSLEKLKQIHGKAVTLGLLCSKRQHLACKLLNTYTQLGSPVDAQKVFNHIQNPDIVSWTCLISLYLHTSQPCKAFSIFSHLFHSGLKPDSFCVVGAVSACGHRKDLSNGRIVHGMVFRFELGSDPIVGNALIDMYSRSGAIEVACSVFKTMEIKDVSSWTSLLNGFIKCNDIEAARRIFDEMPMRNSVSWTAMITGYVQGEVPIPGLELFQEMRAEGKDWPTVITIVAVLSVVLILGHLILEALFMSGALVLALKIFQEMPKRDVFSWTTMISGLALHGKGTHALEAFSDMSKSGVVPNEVTLLSVLSACSHAGLVVEGRSLFQKMVQCHGIKPKIQHYGCMVDLLGRAGLLREAKELIEHMPIKPDSVIWRSLLSACLVHGNLAMAEMAGKMIIELEPDDDGEDAVHCIRADVYTVLEVITEQMKDLDK